MSQINLSRPGRDVLAWSAIAVIVRAVFWIATDRVWEDALITAAHAVNAVGGIGLTHHPGEGQVHGFTSVVSVAIALAGELIAPGSALVAQKLVSLAAAALTILAADDVSRRLGIGRPARQLVMGYLALDQNHIFYGMAGMETQVAVLLLLVSVSLVLARSRIAGASLGLAVLARPDFIIWVACAAAWIVIFARRRVVATSTGLSAVVIPWLLFATWYYGSPIPHTIAAKAAASLSPPGGGGPAEWIGWIVERATANALPLLRTLTPFLEDTLVVATPVAALALLALGLVMFALVTIGAAIHRSDSRWQLVGVFAASYVGYRLVFLPPAYFDWYAPPATAILILFAAAAVERLFAGRHLSLVVVGGLVAAYALHLPWSLPLERQIQREIENGVRVPMALYLEQSVAPGESVGAEPAGYIGFYSRVLLFDYPGLTSPAALAAVRSASPAGRGVAAMIDQLRPDWIVLRPAELADLRDRFPEAAALYATSRVFGAPRATIAVNGLVKATIDGSYIVLRRN
jgi:hypothetical protein